MSEGYELRIYNSRGWLMVSIDLDEEGGESMVDRTGTASFFRVFNKGRRPAIFRGNIGRGGLNLDTANLVMGSDTVTIRTDDLKAL